MDPAEKRRLKKLGKQIVEQQSRDLRERLRESNPAPIGSDEWMRNHKNGIAQDRQLRGDPPNLIPRAEAHAAFVLNEVESGPEFMPVPTWYVECPRCGDLVHTASREFVACGCGNVRLDVSARELAVATPPHPRIVKLIGRGAAPQSLSDPVRRRRPWWRFW